MRRPAPGGLLSRWEDALSCWSRIRPSSSPSGSVQGPAGTWGGSGQVWGPSCPSSPPRQSLSPRCLCPPAVRAGRWPRCAVPAGVGRMPSGNGQLSVHTSAWRGGRAESLTGHRLHRARPAACPAGHRSESQRCWIQRTPGHLQADGQSLSPHFPPTRHPVPPQPLHLPELLSSSPSTGIPLSAPAQRGPVYNRAVAQLSFLLAPGSLTSLGVLQTRAVPGVEGLRGAEHRG